MRQKFIFLLYILFQYSVFPQQLTLISNDETPIRIDSIKITGNNSTKDFVILRELDFSKGDIVTQDQLDFNKERIFSLGLFNQVSLIINSYDNFNELEILVKESWYIYPIPFLNIKDDRIAHASYGIILLYKNFRGRNETITGVASFGYDPAFYITYFNPALISNSNFNFGAKLGYTNIENRNLVSRLVNGKNFDYDKYFGSLSFGYRFNLFNTLTQITSYEYTKVPNNVSSLTATKTNIDRTLSSSLIYEFDSRDLKQFSKNGILGIASLIHKGFGINKINYNLFKVDFREYRQIFAELTAKWRGFYRHTFGKTIPFYELSLLGDSEYVRGHRFNKREGNNYLVSSVELNYPIFKEWNLSLELPPLPNRLTSARIGLYLNLFFDSGTTYNNRESLKIKTFDSGWGFGLTLLLLPHNSIRFEYGFNENMEGELIIESGFSF